MPCCLYSNAFRYPATEVGTPRPMPCSVPVGQIASATQSGRWLMTCPPSQPHTCVRQPFFPQTIRAGAPMRVNWTGSSGEWAYSMDFAQRLRRLLALICRHTATHFRPTHPPKFRSKPGHLARDRA